MKVLYPGHRYELGHIDGAGKTVLQFVQRAPLHPPCEGIICQQLLCMILDRIKELEKEVSSPLNDLLLFHGRQMLCLFEARALMRKAEKGQLLPEYLPVGADGHFIFTTEEVRP